MCKLDDLSIIVCSRNDSVGLKTTLKSLELINNSNFELILVLSDYSKNEIENIRLLVKVCNFIVVDTSAKGVYSAMNLGISRASKEFILFLNGGDALFSADNLQGLLAKIGKNSWGFGAINILKKENHKCYRFKPYFKNLHRLSLKFVPHPATIYRTSFVEKLGRFDTKFKIAADQKMALQASKISSPVTSRLIISNFNLGGISDNRTSHDVVNDFRRISHELNGYFFGIQKIDTLIWCLVLKIRNCKLKYFL